jgi:crotonobetainyl-CoA:carnitine CoA-transferase CaiB-like acyl-CoA transferase
VTLADGTVTQLPTLPLTLGGRRPSAAAQLDAPGANGADVLAGLGYSPDEIAQMTENGAVG